MIDRIILLPSLKNDRIVKISSDLVSHLCPSSYFFLCLSMIPIFLYKLFSQRTKNFRCEWELYENDYPNY